MVERGALGAYGRDLCGMEIIPSIHEEMAFELGLGGGRRVGDGKEGPRTPRREWPLLHRRVSWTEGGGRARSHGLLAGQGLGTNWTKGLSGRNAEVISTEPKGQTEEGG